MGKTVDEKPCPLCREQGYDKSGDNLKIYEDGSDFCFRCWQKVTKVDNNIIFQDLLSWHLTKDTCEKYGIGLIKYKGNLGKGKSLTSYDGTKRLPVFIYKENDSTIKYKIRSYQNRKLCTIKGNAEANCLFGIDLFKPDPTKFLVITEGEKDAASVWQALRVPCVSISKGAGFAYEELQYYLDYLLGWKYIIIAFDNDDAGIKATNQCVTLFDPGSVRVAHLTLKDANAMLVAGKTQDLSDCIYNAREIKLTTVVKPQQITLEDFSYLDGPLIEWPFPVMQKILHGMPLRAVTCLMAREKSGKSLLVRTMALDLTARGIKVGVLTLEETHKDFLLQLVAMKLNVPPYKIVEEMNDITKRESYINIINKLPDNLYLYDHKNYIDKDSIYAHMSYMARTSGCKVIFLDNISLITCGSTNEKYEIDNLLDKLRTLAINTNTCIFIVTHAKVKENKQGVNQGVEMQDTYGSSRYLAFCSNVIAMEAEEGYSRLKVIVGRWGTKKSVYADTLTFNEDTHTLSWSKTGSNLISNGDYI